MSELTPLTGEALNTLRGDFAQSGTNRLAMNAVTAAGIDKVARNYDRAPPSLTMAKPPIRIAPAAAGCSAR